MTDGFQRTHARFLDVATRKLKSIARPIVPLMLSIFGCVACSDRWDGRLHDSDEALVAWRSSLDQRASDREYRMLHSVVERGPSVTRSDELRNIAALFHGHLGAAVEAYLSGDLERLRNELAAVGPDELAETSPPGHSQGPNRIKEQLDEAIRRSGRRARLSANGVYAVLLAESGELPAALSRVHATSDEKERSLLLCVVGSPGEPTSSGAVAELQALLKGQTESTTPEGPVVTQDVATISEAVYWARAKGIEHANAFCNSIEPSGRRGLARAYVARVACGQSLAFVLLDADSYLVP